MSTRPFALATLLLTFTLALSAAPALDDVSPVGSARAECVIVLDDGGCTSVCIEAGQVLAHVPKAPAMECTM